MIRYALAVLGVVLLVSINLTDDVAVSTEPITAATLDRLDVAGQLDFDTLPDDISVTAGWFRLHHTGRYAALRAETSLVLVDLVDMMVVADYGTGLDLVDAAFTEDALLSLHFDGSRYQILRFDLTDERVLPIRAAADVWALGQPVRLWGQGDGERVWLEMLPERDTPLVVGVPAVSGLETLVLPSAPYADVAAIGRNARARPPAAVVLEADATVRRFDLETGTDTGSITLLELPLFSRINDMGGDLIPLRVPAEATLYLGDFSTGEAQPLAALQAEPTALMVNTAGDVVLAVGLDDDPVVVAWEVATGEQTSLGTYRGDCTRLPDMVRLSGDGTTLVIGCDVGLEMWRIHTP